MKKLLDANLIIRYLVEDDRKKADKIEKLLHSKDDLILTDVTISEIVWVLASYYKLNREEIAERLEALLLLPNIKTNEKLLLQALSYYRQHKIDWVDAYLASFAKENNLKSVYSYDKDLDRIREITRREP